MAGGPLELKAMSFNIRYGTADDGPNAWEFRREAVLDFLGTSGYHVIGLQEVLAAQLEEIRRALPHYRTVGVGRDDGLAAGEYCAILFDTRHIQVGSAETFWFSDTPEVVASTSWGNTLPRICTHASFLADGHRFEVYNLHIDHASAVSRERSIAMLVHRIQSHDYRRPTIVMGDFNEGESGPAIALIEGAGFEDSYRAVNPEGTEPATYHGWQEIVDGPKIDYIFLKGPWEVQDAPIIRDTTYSRFLSDHYPIGATLRLE